MEDSEVRNPFEKLAIPHQFPPRLSLVGAVVAVTAALTQILFGCLIAALWGVQIWLSAVSRHSVVFKSFAISGLVVGMAASLGLLIFGVNALAERLRGKS